MAILKIDFDGLKKNNWSEQETQNAKLVVDFVQHLMNNHDFDYIMDKFGKGPYVQHNRSMLDGLKGVVEYVSKFVKRFPDFTYDVKHIYVDGQYVTHNDAVISVEDRGFLFGDAVYEVRVDA